MICSPGLICVAGMMPISQACCLMRWTTRAAGFSALLMMRLRPGVPGLSESATVISIVGRFLEHSRVLYFRNGGDEEYFIGSADCMKRNLNSRVEVYAPVEVEGLREKLRQMLDLQLNDHRSAWEMRPDGSYVQRR